MRPAIRDLLDRLKPDLVLAPQAIGGHVDHVVAVQALRDMMPPTPVLWWQDFPYVARKTAARAPFMGDMASLPEWSVRFPFEPKHGACAAYASQLAFQFGGRTSLAAMLAEAGPLELFRCERLDAMPKVLRDPEAVR